MGNIPRVGVCTRLKIIHIFLVRLNNAFDISQNKVLEKYNTIKSWKICGTIPEFCSVPALRTLVPSFSRINFCKRFNGVLMLDLLPFIRIIIKL